MKRLSTYVPTIILSTSEFRARCEKSVLRAGLSAPPPVGLPEHSPRPNCRSARQTFSLQVLGLLISSRGWPFGPPPRRFFFLPNASKKKDTVEPRDRRPLPTSSPPKELGLCRDRASPCGPRAPPKSRGYLGMGVGSIRLGFEFVLADAQD